MRHDVRLPLPLPKVMLRNSAVRPYTSKSLLTGIQFVMSLANHTTPDVSREAPHAA